MGTGTCPRQRLNVPNGSAHSYTDYSLFVSRSPNPFSNFDFFISLSARLAGSNRLARSSQTVV